MPDKLSEVVLILVGSTMIILALTSLVITALVISRKRRFRHDMEITELRNQYERELLRAQLEIQSQTFQTISRELHDNVGTLLSIALVHLNSKQNTAEVQSLLNEAMDTLRDISKSLNPETITSLGWQRSFFTELQRVGRLNMFTIKTSIEGEPLELEATKQIILFRILQEAVNNIVKHAEAKEVRVQVIYGTNEMKISVHDDGRGISNGTDTTISQGSGIKNMKARAAMLPAELFLDSKPGSGTSITISYKN